MYKLFFLDPTINTGNILVMIYTFSFIPFSFGLIYLLRFFRERDRHSLWVSTSLIMGPPLLAAVVIQLLCWYMDYIGGPNLVSTFH